MTPEVESRFAEVAAQASEEAKRRLDALSDDDRRCAVTLLMNLRVVADVPRPPKDETSMGRIAALVVKVMDKDPVMTDRIRTIAGFEVPVQRLVVEALLPDCFSRLESLKEGKVVLIE